MKLKYLIFLMLLLSGCVTTKEFSHLPMVKDKTRLDQKDADYETTLQFQFYGTAGGMLSLGDEGLLMDPFVSNPSILKLIFGKKLTSNDKLIKATFTNLDIVKGIIIGHGHYDHLMDVPAVMGLCGMSDKVKVYADQVSAYQLNNFESTKGKIEVVDGNIDKPYDKGAWYSLPGGNIKIYPVRSGHAPNVWRFRVPFGTRNEPMRDNDVPRTFCDWKAGAFLNYAVVITHPVSKVSYRIYIQSSASDCSIGSPPKGMMEDIGGFNLLILSAASFDKVDQYPSQLLARTKPHDVILVHWHDFFDQNEDIEREPKAAPGLNLDKLLSEIRSVDSSINVSIPTPNSIVKISKRE